MSLLIDTNELQSYWLRILHSTLHPPVQMLGSLAKLAIVKIPETSSGLRVARNCIQRLCQELDDNCPENADHFRQLFVVVYILAFDLCRHYAPILVSHTPMCKSKLWPISPFRGANRPIVQDFVSFFTAKRRDSLTLGSSYLQYV